jgi:hypothetical protein
MIAAIGKIIYLPTGEIIKKMWYNIIVHTINISLVE